MTIKRRLFFSNIRMVFVVFISFGFASRLALFFMYGTGRPERHFHDYYDRDMRMMIWFLIFAVFIILMSLLNNFFTHRMTRRILKPLDPLGEGVRQIHDNNFSFRIDYKYDNEFRPICEAFNEMAAKLESSTAKQKKDEANRRELIAGISHDLRTPLTSIKGYIEGIETGVASTPEMRDNYIAVIKSKAEAMEHIIEQLFLFSKLDMDEFPLAMRRVDISEAVGDMIEASVSEYASRGLDIKFSEIKESVYVSVDVFMLRNVIDNILENSVKYKTKERGRMEIGISVEGGFVLLRLSDDGTGVQTDMLSKLFDVFYRTDPSRSRSGSGLGLAISAKIIERMGGGIHAEQPAGGGLSIAISLPIVSS
jgi:signal transduction histidine kinase